MKSARQLHATPISRHLAMNDGPRRVPVTLREWEGIPLMMHPRADRVAGGWTCTHEPTGFAITHGETAQEAFELATIAIKTKRSRFAAEIAKHPVINR